MEKVMRLLLLATLLLSACESSRAAEERAERDLLLGLAENERFRFIAEDGAVHVRELTENSVTARTSAAELRIRIERKAPELESLTLRLWNLPPTFRLRAERGVLGPDDVPVSGTPDPSLTLGASWTVRFPPGTESVELEAARRAPTDFTFLAFGDIQGGIDRFEDVIAKVNAEPEADFILMLGDLTSTSRQNEFERVEAAYAQIRFPIYATPGNHDVFTAEAYQERFGRASFSIMHKGVRFTSVDSASAALAPSTWQRLGSWLEAGRSDPHVIFSHIPATEPTGLRSGQWNSRREARHFIAASAEAGVDLLLFGHIHSFDGYALNGIPAFISGGCGAIEEQLDGIDRHFLRIHVRDGRPEVEVVRVD
jgi:3',5'-cyclic-AMP phosphodiesterase